MTDTQDSTSGPTGRTEARTTLTTTSRAFDREDGLPGTPLTAPVGLGLLVITVALLWGAGLAGLLAAIPVGMVALVLPIPFVIGAAHVAFVAVGADVTLVHIVGFELGVFILLSATVSPSRTGLISRVLGATGIGAIALGVTFVAANNVFESLAWGSAVSGGVFALSAYAIYRYGVIQREFQEEY